MLLKTAHFLFMLPVLQTGFCFLYKASALWKSSWEMEGVLLKGTAQGSTGLGRLAGSLVLGSPTLCHVTDSSCLAGTGSFGSTWI